MSHNLSQNYSSVIINQNQSYEDSVSLGVGYVQEFHLPADYRRGTEADELRYPDLSGLQLMVEVAEGYSRYAAFDYEVQYQVFGLGWVTAVSGVSVGAPVDGTTWMNAHFDQPVQIDPDKANGRWRIVFGSARPLGDELRDVVVPYANGEANVLGTRILVDLTLGEPYHFTHNDMEAFLYLDPIDGQVYFSYEQGLTGFMYTSPNPLALPSFDRAYDTTGSVLQGDSGDASFNFRILAMTADDGVDFLGNEYRSIVVQNEANAISTAMGADPDSYWLSKPNPSKFAVECLYFDVRKSGSTTFGRENKILNPSFETNEEGWLDNGTGTFPGSMNISDEWATSGSKSMQWKGSSPAPDPSFPGFQTALLPAKAGRDYSCRADVKSVEYPTGGTQIDLLLRFYDVDEVAISDTAPDSLVGIGEATLNTEGTAPEGTLWVQVIIYTESTASSTGEFYMDSICLVENADAEPYFDGDREAAIWSGQAHLSESFELIAPTTDDVATVVDKILVDPVTPGAYFNMYYSNEGDPGLNEDQWESKLWTRVPQTFRMERRETHVLPEPISAKYIKVEFSHLQARHYAPGNFQQPIRYKKHPKWVLDYFLARMQTDNAFLAQRVKVIYDALDLAYNYYLDDLGQEPESTIDVNGTALSEVSGFLTDRQDVSDRIDQGTLNKIDLALKPYRDHPALRGYGTSLLGDYARQTVSTFEDYPVEVGAPLPNTSADVSSLNRDRVVLEQNYPVMFFYLTSRHKYREIEAKFSHDRAYFAGVRQIAFLRDNYMTAFDTSTYIEPAADTLNIERNEF